MHVAALAALQAARQAGFRRGEHLALSKCGRGGPFLWRRVRKFRIMRLTPSYIEPEVGAFRYLAVGYGRFDASKRFIVCASGYSMEGGRLSARMRVGRISICFVWSLSLLMENIFLKQTILIILIYPLKMICELWLVLRR